MKTGCAVAAWARWALACEALLGRDGAAVGRVGELTYPLVRDLVDTGASDLGPAELTWEDDA